MIAASCGIATVITTLFCVYIVFDNNCRLRLERVQKNVKQKKKNGDVDGHHHESWLEGLKGKVSGLWERGDKTNDEERRPLLRS